MVMPDMSRSQEEGRRMMRLDHISWPFALYMNVCWTHHPSVFKEETTNFERLKPIADLKPELELLFADAGSEGEKIPGIG